MKKDKTNGHEFIPRWDSDIFLDHRDYESSPEKAAEYLKLVIEPLRNGEAVPDPVATFLADAIELAMAKKTTKEKIKALSDELFLSANNRRAKGNLLVIGRDFDEHYNAEIERRKELGESSRGAQVFVIKIISKKYEISSSLARTHWINWKKAMADYRAEMLGELD